MRKFLIGVFYFWVLIVCLINQDEKEQDNSSEVVSQDRVEIVFWHAMGGPLGKAMNELVKEFNDSQPTYFIKSVCMGQYNTLQKKLLASLVAERAPDISQNYESLTKKFIKHKKIVCLEPLLASEPENIRADIIPVLLANNMYDGKIWSFPFNKSVPVLYYNKDLFKEAGIDPDSPPKTLDDLASYARRLTRRDTDGSILVRGFASTKGGVWLFLNRVLQFGGRIISADGKEAFFDEEPAVRALAYQLDLLKEGCFEEAQGFEHQNGFIAQTVAMIESSIVSKVYMESGIRFNLGVAPLPGQASHGVILSGTNINIFDNGDPQKIAGAWEFTKWFTSTDVGARWSIKTTYIPVRKSSLECPRFIKAMNEDPNLSPPYVQLDYAQFEPRFTSWFEIRDLMADVLEKATLEMGDPQTYLSKMNEDINGILAHSTE